MKQLRHICRLVLVAIVIFIGLSLSSCATSGNASSAKKRQGYMLMSKSEYSMNKGRYKETKKPKAIRKRKKNAHKMVF